jgi:cytochrome c
MAALFLAFPNAEASGDESQAVQAFNTHCRSCHSFKKADHRLGPSLYGIFGKQAGRAEGYGGYSGALRGMTWDEQTLDAFLRDPASVSTSTNMIFPPVTDALTRAKIISFLKTLHDR